MGAQINGDPGAGPIDPVLLIVVEAVGGGRGGGGQVARRGARPVMAAGGGRGGRQTGRHSLDAMGERATRLSTAVPPCRRSPCTLNTTSATTPTTTTTSPSSCGRDQSGPGGRLYQLRVNVHRHLERVLFLHVRPHIVHPRKVPITDRTLGLARMRVPVQGQRHGMAEALPAEAATELQLRICHN